MTQRVIASLAFGAYFGLIGASVRAGVFSEPRPVSDLITNAELIVVVSIESYASDRVVTQQVPEYSTDSKGEIAAEAICQPGIYGLKRLHVLKGDCEAQIQLHLPLVSGFYYGQNRFEITRNSHLLLLLKHDESNHWVPVDPLLPLVPLSGSDNSAPDAVGVISKVKSPDAVDVMLSSIGDAKLRPTMIHVLRDVKDERLAAVMWKYADDDDLRIRSDALYCSAVNQDVKAIPKIAKLSEEMERRHFGSGRASALQLFDGPAATVYLNPLVVDGTEYIRLNAIMALRPIADESSIPFLMKALDKDDSQHIVAYGAYFTLHRLIGPSLPPALSKPQFLARKDEETQILKQWWEWEQVKAKKAAATQNAQTQPATQPSPANP